jgi:hypothetical protein
MNIVKLNFMKRALPLLSAIILSIFAINAKAQSEFSGLIRSGPADATKLLNAYSDPLFKGFGAGMNSGWFSTAKAKKLLHLDVRILASAAFIPSSDKTFDVTKIGLSSNIKPADPSQTLAPTIGGNRNNGGPTLDVYDDNGRKVESFTLPSGKLPVIPTPQLQVTIGLIKNTDLTLRGFPKVDLGDDVGSVSMIGFGLKHDLIQDFVGKTASKVIPFDLAIALAYSRLNMSVPLDVQPDAGSRPASGQHAADYSNQHVDGHFNSFLVQAILSKQLLFFTPYVTLGYNTANANVAAIGNYPVTTGSTLTGDETYTVYTNPVNIKETSISGFRADLGFQLSLGFFKVYASYTAAQYHSVNGGIGFGF